VLFHAGRLSKSQFRSKQAYYAKPIVVELGANMVRVDADFSGMPFKAKISDVERWLVRTMLHALHWWV